MDYLKKDLKLKDVLPVLFVFLCIFFSLMIYLFYDRAVKKEIDEKKLSIKTKIEELSDLPKKERIAVEEHKSNVGEVEYDNLYKIISKIFFNYEIKSGAMYHKHVESNGENYFPVDMTVSIVADHDTVYEIESNLGDDLIAYNKRINGDETELNFTKRFVFNSYYSLKDLSVDNINKQETIASDDTSSKDEEAADDSNGTELKEVYNRYMLIDICNENIVYSPTSEGVTYYSEKRVFPGNFDNGLMISLENNNTTDTDCAVIFSFMKYCYRILVPNLNVELALYNFDKKDLDIELIIADSDNNFHDVEGIFDDSGVVFKLTNKYNYPITVEGLKINLKSQTRCTLGVKNFIIAIEKKISDSIAKREEVITLNGNHFNTVDDLLNNYHVSDMKSTFIKDNNIKSDGYLDRNFYILRPDRAYSIYEK